MRIHTLLLGTAFVAFLGMGPLGAANEEPIGAVAQQKPSGAIGIAAATGAERPLPYQAGVYQDDTIVTRDDGTQLQFTDKTLLTVSSNSKVKLDSFVFQKDSGTLAGRITLGIGVFRFVTGALVKHDNLDMVTPVSVLSIRGTDFVVSVDRDGTTMVRLYEGRLRIKSCAGKYLWVHAGQRITISPNCMIALQNVGSDTVLADAGNGGDGNGAGGGGDPSGGGGDPSGGGGDPSGGGDTGGPSTSGHDPGTGNGGENGNGNGSGGDGNGGTSGNGHDAGTGNGNGKGNAAH